MSARETCPACGAAGMRTIHRAASVPTNSCILLDTVEEARAWPRGEIDLRFCDACGFASNMAFDSGLTEYSDRYEETQGFSPTFSRFHTELARSVVERHDLHGKRVLEIGCGKGEFLMLLCEMGAASGVGFDPAYIPARNTSGAADSARFIRDFYSEKYKDESADFYCCKMTLEHIHPVREFIGTVRAAVGSDLDATIFFQVPDVTRILRECSFEDIYYEHCSYFAPGSIARLFRECGFRVDRVATEYDDQYLTLEAVPVESPAAPHPSEDDLPGLIRLADDFSVRCRNHVLSWRDRLDDLKRRDATTVIWGSGSKGVSFLTTLDVGEEVAGAVDINPHRQGHVMPGTGHRILAPEDLMELNPDAVVVMNSIYAPEIGAQLRELGLTPELLTLEVDA
ncbi:MAG TPA: class I SAM-dependent methyltransferase [Candidatus Krumholzibacteria bacterium]|nr:class I SAM-dependent methyltransferase [Candidatus Krumholzibacteria bacterium]HRX52428.1 class I SAM-dependent methyltransferase [Candidatus Krumholzibacteria bacterium]